LWVRWSSRSQADGVLALGLFPALDLVPGVVQRAVLAVLVDDVQQRAADALQDIGIVGAQRAAVGAFGRWAPRLQRAFVKAALASATRKAMPLAEGPWSVANSPA
jgi:hypothetical protein